MELLTTTAAKWGALPFRTEIEMQSHAWAADEPQHLSGGNTAPTPFDYVTGALAACTAITIRMYAQRKEWPLEDVHVACEMWQANGETTFKREVSLVGNELTPDQRQRLLQVANACPTHKLLAKANGMETTLAD
jgi:putative redox protein